MSNEMLKLAPDQVLLMKLAGMIEQDQCGDLWDMNDISEDDHARLPDLLRKTALRAAAASAEPNPAATCFWPKCDCCMSQRAASAEPVADTWLVGGPPDLRAMSGDAEDERVIRLHFRRKATEQDRAWLLEAINAKLTHPAPDAEIVAALEAMLDEYDRNVCEHEITHRGGHIWTICDGCGRKWADDEGGFVPHVDPPHVIEARAALAKAKGGSRT